MLESTQDSIVLRKSYISIITIRIKNIFLLQKQSYNGWLESEFQYIIEEEYITNERYHEFWFNDLHQKETLV